MDITQRLPGQCYMGIEELPGQEIPDSTGLSPGFPSVLAARIPPDVPDGIPQRGSSLGDESYTANPFGQEHWHPVLSLLSCAPLNALYPVLPGGQETRTPEDAGKGRIPPLAPLSQV